MSIQSNNIMLNITTNDTITVKGNITPITLTQNDFQKEWEEFANFRIAEPEREYTTSTFQSFSQMNQFQLVIPGRLMKRV